MDMDLLEKTELRIDGIVTEGTNLTRLAATVATVLDLPPDKVMVIDVRALQVSLDILARALPAESFFGKKRALLTALAAVPGVGLTPDADIHSEGILCAIGLDETGAVEALEKSGAMGRTIGRARRARIRVFPTGFELQQGRIEDTNTPYLVKILGEAGFLPEAAAPLADDHDALVDALSGATADNGLLVTTGGVGAEDKDFSVEAMKALDPTAATPYLVRFDDNHHRHVKGGVRIAVAERDGCLMVALPGPHDEVRRAGPVLVQGYKRGLDKHALAQLVAEAIRAKFRAAGQPGVVPAPDAPHSHAPHGDVQ